MTLEWIESHCHIDFPEFDQDRAEVFASCNRLGISRVIVPGVEPVQWHRLVDQSKVFSEYYFSVGLHPCWIDITEQQGNLTEAAIEASIRSLVNHERCVAIGECGLDAMINFPMNAQIPWFELQLRLAAELNLPVVIHMRRTFNEVLRLLKQYRSVRGGVIHAFSGSYEMAMQLVDAGFYLGVGGTITYERANKTRNAIRDLPLKYLLLETDSPDMPLCGFQGQRNSPEKIIEVAKCLAELKQVSLDEIAAATTKNAKDLFGV